MKVLLVSEHFDREGFLNGVVIRLRAESMAHYPKLIEKAAEIRALWKAFNLHDFSIEHIWRVPELTLSAFKTRLWAIQNKGRTLEVVPSDIPRKLSRVERLMYASPLVSEEEREVEAYVATLKQQLIPYRARYQQHSDAFFFAKGSVYEHLDRDFQKCLKEFPEYRPPEAKKPSAQVLEHLKANPWVREHIECALCKPEVSDTQVFYQGYEFKAHFNHRPYCYLGNENALPGLFHFMVLTVQHDLTLSDMKPWQQRELIAAQHTLFEWAAEVFGEHAKLVSFIQEHGAGMTQPHFHWHVLKVPPRRDYLHNLLYQAWALAGDRACDIAPVSKEAMAEIRNQSGSRLRTRHMQRWLASCWDAGLFSPRAAQIGRENVLNDPKEEKVDTAKGRFELTRT